MAPTFLDRLFNQAALTELTVQPVQTAMEAERRLGDTIAPLQNVDGQYVSLRVRDVHAFGIGQYKAPEATPPLVDLTGREESESIFELVALDEMHRISPTRWERLQSTDEAVLAEEARRLVEIGQELEIRNQRLTEKMRWDAFKGTLIVQYQQGDAVLQIDYPKPTGHNPTVSVFWTDTVNADPIADIKGWQTQIANSAGFAGTRVHLSSDDYELIVNNQKLKGYFNIPVGQPFRPQQDDIEGLLEPGTQLVITNAGYRASTVGASRAAADHTRYLPVGKVFVTTPYTVEGQRIADTPNGDVQIVTGYNSTAFLKGPTSEVKLDLGSMQYFLRHASRRIPRILHPECLLYASVRA
jgi:hypothetical protein